MSDFFRWCALIDPEIDHVPAVKVGMGEKLGILRTP
jgi:hypothetical protein